MDRSALSMWKSIYYVQLTKYIDVLPQEATNVRKNQTQIDINGKKVGTNRPDLQYDLNDIHYNVESGEACRP